VAREITGKLGSETVNKAIQAVRHVIVAARKPASDAN
jgi:hypothetical protein